MPGKVCIMIPYPCVTQKIKVTKLKRQYIVPKCFFKLASFKCEGTAYQHLILYY